MWNVQDRRGQVTANDAHSLTARWNSCGRDWVCHVGAASEGISFGDPDEPLHLSVMPPGPDVLPVADEQHVRGDEWKVSLPQADGQFSLRMSVRVIEATQTRWVIEPTFSIQTSLLDTHPTLDLRAAGQSPLAVSDSQSASVSMGELAHSITSVGLPCGGGQVHVLLGSLDAPFTQDLSTADRLHLRLFGEFLEKGVIRKARPWIILDSSESGVSVEELTSCLDQLNQTPLPLTA